MSFLLGFAAWLALNAWMTRQVLRAPSESLHSKPLLVVGIWLMPLLGALIAQSELRTCAASGSGAPAAMELDRREPAPDRISATGVPDFELRDHRARIIITLHAVHRHHANLQGTR